MHDQRREWESILFAESPNPDDAALETYLRSIFDQTSQAKKLSEAPLKLLWETMGAFNLGDLDAKSPRRYSKPCFCILLGRNGVCI